MKQIAALAVSLSVLMAQSDRPALHNVTAIRHWSLADVTRIAIEVSGDFKFRSDRLHNPERVYFDILNTQPKFENRRLYSESIDDKLVQRVRVAETLPGITRVVVDLAATVEVSTSQLTNPSRLMIEMRAGGPAPGIPTSSPVPAPRLPSPPRGLTDPSTPPKPPPAIKADAAPSAALTTAEPSKEQMASAKTRQPTLPSVVKADAKSGGPASTTTEASKDPIGAATTRPSKPPSVVRPDGAASTASTTPDSRKEPITPARTTPPKLPAVTKAEAQPAADSTLAQAPFVDPWAAEKINSPKVEVAEKLTTAPGAALDNSKPDVAPPITAELGKAARRTSSGNSSLVRALGLKVGRVVIDPGHGGHDQGTEGPHGLMEKELVLDVAKRVGRLIEDRMGAEVIYTRSDDSFIPLEGRTALANDRKADLFLSIHANSSPVPRIAGVETYYLNFNPSKEAMDVAARENATSQMSIFDLQDIVQKITLHDKAEESREFAGRLQTALFTFSAKNFPTEKNRGVKKAPFVVLIGATMPSVLAEIGFLSNPREEALLKKSDYRQKLAEALYRGISRYADTLSHFQLAKNQQ